MDWIELMVWFGYISILKGWIIDFHQVESQQQTMLRTLTHLMVFMVSTFKGYFDIVLFSWILKG